MKNPLQKSADGRYSSPWWIFVPGAGILGKNPDVSKLPNMGLGPEGNAFLWNTIGNSLTVGGITAAATILAHNWTKGHLKHKVERNHETKVNALSPISTPNTAPDVKAVKEVRSIGVRDVAKKRKKQEEEKEPMQKSAMFVDTVLPLLATIPVSAGVYEWTRSELEKKHKEDLDKEIAEKRNHLDKLYAKMLKLRAKEGAPIVKSASMNKEAGLGNLGLGLLYTSFGLAPILAAIGAYKYTKTHDDDILKRKILEKQIMSQNLTNIPDTLEVVTGENETIPTSRKEQKYIDELNKTVEELG